MQYIYFVLMHIETVTNTVVCVWAYLMGPMV